MSEETVKYILDSSYYGMGVEACIYFSDDGLTTCNECLMLFFPEGYWNI